LGFLKLPYHKFIKTSHLCLSLLVFGCLGVSPVMSGRLHGCCCDKVGILTDATTFAGSLAAPCKTDFEKMYDGKADVVRVDSIETLNSCSVVYFGVVRLVGASTQTPSLYPSYDNWLGTGSAIAVNAQLYEYVRKGGKIVAIGETLGRSVSGTAIGTIEANLNTMNETLLACRNGVSAGLTILPDVATANLTTCTQANLGCSCSVTQINRYFVGRVSVPSGDLDGEIFKSSDEATQHWISAFGVGHSSGGISLTDDVSASFSNLNSGCLGPPPDAALCCQTPTSTLRPFAYEKIEKGYIMYLGDRNMFAWQRSLEGALIVPSLAPCGVSNTTFPTTINCFTGPAGEYTGLNVYEANKFFLWSLLKPCSSC
jgi:hypothetical protein